MNSLPPPQAAHVLYVHAGKLEPITRHVPSPSDPSQSTVADHISNVYNFSLWQQQDRLPPFTRNPDDDESKLKIDLFTSKSSINSIETRTRCNTANLYSFVAP
ncbi:hypothetical protein Drorol1_Dr00000501 [Drosera rotundifolia]